MPVVAYLDAGIYCHPIVPGVVDAVKVGYYNPPDVPRGTTTIDSIDAFVERCFPALHGMPSTKVEDVDQCDYDLVADDDFVLGAIPGAANAFVGVGGAAPATSSPRGSGGCSPSLPFRREPSTTSTASIPPVSRTATATDAPVAKDPATTAH